MNRALIVFVVLLLSLASPSLLADTIAASLYEEGIALLKEKKFAQACAKLDASFKREPLSGTLMVLAQCHELSGKTATAWDEYQRARALARTEGREEYETKANELSMKLEPKLSRLKLELAPGVERDRLVVTLAGDAVDVETVGVALALDPGDYEVAASAPGFKAWSMKVTVKDPGKTITVTIPALERAPEIPQPEVVPPAPPAPIRPTPTPQPDPDQGAEEGGIPVWAWVAGGIGLASAAVSFAFLGVNRGVASELDDQCGGEARDDCPPREAYDAEGDHDTEKLSNGLFIGFGAAAIVGIGVGIAGIIVGSSSTDTGRLLPLVSPRFGGLLYERRF